MAKTLSKRLGVYILTGILVWIFQLLGEYSENRLSMGTRGQELVGLSNEGSGRRKGRSIKAQVPNSRNFPCNFIRVEQQKLQKSVIMDLVAS